MEYLFGVLLLETEIFLFRKSFSKGNIYLIHGLQRRRNDEKESLRKK